MSLRALDPVFVHAEIEHLKRTHPEIWDSADTQFKLDALEGQTSFNEFLTETIRQILMADALLRGISAVITDMQARRDSFERRIEALRALAFKVMEHAGERSVTLPAATLSIRQGSQKVVITDEASLPGHMFRVRAEPNKTVIKECLMAGDIVPGAQLSNAEPVLHMRVK